MPTTRYDRSVGRIDAASAEAEPPERRAFPLAQLPDPPAAAAAAPAAQGASPATTRPAPRPVHIEITAVYQGYTIAIGFDGSVTQISDAIERLRVIGATPTAQPAQQWSYTPEGLPICPRHNAPMKRREKQGDTWYSHVTTAPDGEECYCRGYQGKDSPGYAY